MTTGRPEGHRWKVFCQLVFRTYGDVCHLCGCGGAKQVDHLESVTEHPELVFVLTNCRPAHGSPKNPCLVCSAKAGRNIFCNQLRGAMSIERAQKLIAERTGTAATIAARKQPAVRPAAAGREW